MPGRSGSIQSSSTRSGSAPATASRADLTLSERRTSKPLVRHA